MMMWVAMGFLATLWLVLLPSGSMWLHLFWHIFWVSAKWYFLWKNGSAIIETDCHCDSWIPYLFAIDIGEAVGKQGRLIRVNISMRAKESSLMELLVLGEPLLNGGFLNRGYPQIIQIRCFWYWNPWFLGSCILRNPLCWLVGDDPLDGPWPNRTFHHPFEKKNGFQLQPAQICHTLWYSNTAMMESHQAEEGSDLSTAMINKWVLPTSKSPCKFHRTLPQIPLALWWSSKFRFHIDVNPRIWQNTWWNMLDLSIVGVIEGNGSRCGIVRVWDPQPWRGSLIL